MIDDVCLIVHPYTHRKDLGFGHDRYAYELKAGLEATGQSCHVVGTGEHTSIAAAMTSELSAMRQLVSTKARVFHATATLNAQCAITTRRHPLITTIHDVLWYFVPKKKYDSSAKFYIKTFAIKRAALNSDAIVVPFPSIGRFLVDRFGVPESKINVIHHGVDHSVFFPRGENEIIERPTFFPTHGRVVLFVGGLTFGKGVDTLIKAFAQVVDRVKDAQLVLGSKGWDEAALRALRDASPVKNQIHFVGFIPEKSLRQAYLSSEVMVFPSRYGFGLSTLESMACGTPTVSGNCLDGPESVGDAGLLIDPNSADEISRNILRLLEDPTLHRDLSERGKRWAQNFRWDKTVVATHELYRKFL